MGTNDGMLKVDFGALAQASVDIQAMVKHLDSGLSDLDSAAKPLVATWLGDAQDAYHARQQKWTSAANDIKTMLTSIKTAVDQACSEYHVTEKKNQNLFT